MSTKNYKQKTIKLSEDNYVKPTVTASELLDPDEIQRRLRNYEAVEKTSVGSIVPASRIQYFELLPDGKYRYKPGGSVVYNGYPAYLVLTNGKRNWSVQLENHLIYREIDIEKVRRDFEEVLAEKDKKIEHLKSLIEKQKKTIAGLKKS